MTRFAYAAHTRNAVFYLDDEGVCQDVAGTDGAPAPTELLRCIGAQYVASLDLRQESGLAPLPREGASMLFVVADAHMRFSLVRTATLERFETLASTVRHASTSDSIAAANAPSHRRRCPAAASPIGGGSAAAAHRAPERATRSTPRA